MDPAENAGFFKSRQKKDSHFEKNNRIFTENIQPNGINYNL